jgi:hypothetical protein
VIEQRTISPARTTSSQVGWCRGVGWRPWWGVSRPATKADLLSEIHANLSVGSVLWPCCDSSRPRNRTARAFYAPERCRAFAALYVVFDPAKFHHWTYCFDHPRPCLLGRRGCTRYEESTYTILFPPAGVFVHGHGMDREGHLAVSVGDQGQLCPGAAAAGPPGRRTPCIASDRVPG